MIKLQELLSEIQPVRNERYVYAISDRNGSYIDLEIYSSNQILDDTEENEEGVGIMRLRNDENAYEYFIGKIKI